MTNKLEQRFFKPLKIENIFPYNFNLKRKPFMKTTWKKYFNQFFFFCVKNNEAIKKNGLSKTGVLTI